MSDPKKPFFGGKEEPKSAPKDASKDPPTESQKPAPPGPPGQRGPGVPGGPGPFVESPEPKEKQAGAPASSENEAIKRQAEKAQAAGQRRAVGPEGDLPSDLKALQAESAEPDAPHRKLIQPRKDDTGHSEPGALAAPVAEAGGMLPRFVSQNERSPDPRKFTRFRIRSDASYGPQPVRYVLAADEESACAYYLHATGLRKVMGRLGEDAPDPMLSVIPLGD